MEAGLAELVPHVEVHVGQDGELPAGLDKAGTGGQHERRPVVVVLEESFIKLTYGEKQGAGESIMLTII